jgi:hypothetical protein
MTENQTPQPLRLNPQPLPPGLARRNLPRIDDQVFTARAATFEVLEEARVRPGPVQPRIVSTAHGPLRHLLLTYPAYADGEFSYQAVYADLFAKLPPTTRFTILTHPDVVADLEAALDQAGAGERSTVVEAPDFLNFLVWAEDPYVVVHDAAQDPPTVFLIEPFTFPRAGDASIADLIAEATSVQGMQSPLYFQGGNILIGDDFVLIGADYPARTLELIQGGSPIIVPPDIPPTTFVRDLYRRTFDPDRRVLYAGTRLPVPAAQPRAITIDGEEWTEWLYVGTGTAQPIFHIDMLISLAGRADSGRYQVLVGSPSMADRLLDRPTVPQAMAPIFDDIARQLQNQGFEVIRNPLPITYVDDPVLRERSWYFATSNNCLVQIDDETGKDVWLPTYGHGPWSELAATDAENARIWQELGFTVHQLADFNPFAQNLGAVHCIKKYLER